MLPRRKRACLEQGLSLNINLLARWGTVRFGDLTLFGNVSWGSSPGDVVIGKISSNLIGHQGWIQVDIEGKKQRFEVISESRHFGGCQRYFVCPATRQKASVLWRPPGATEFRSRRGWGKSVAYITQIGSWTDRAHRGKEKIVMALAHKDCVTHTAMPPKPKWMRSRTYDRYAVRFGRYDHALAQGPEGRQKMPRRKET